VCLRTLCPLKVRGFVWKSKRASVTGGERVTRFEEVNAVNQRTENGASFLWEALSLHTP
jgi:hypothetical protein